MKAVIYFHAIMQARTLEGCEGKGDRFCEKTHTCIDRYIVKNLCTKSLESNIRVYPCSYRDDIWMKQSLLLTCTFSFGFSTSFFTVSIALIFFRSSTNFNLDTSRSKKFSIIFICDQNNLSLHMYNFQKVVQE